MRSQHFLAHRLHLLLGRQQISSGVTGVCITRRNLSRISSLPNRQVRDVGRFARSFSSQVANSFSAAIAFGATARTLFQRRSGGNLLLHRVSIRSMLPSFSSWPSEIDGVGFHERLLGLIEHARDLLHARQHVTHANVRRRVVLGRGRKSALPMNSTYPVGLCL